MNNAAVCTICRRSPLLYSEYTMKIGQDFLDIRYIRLSWIVGIELAVQIAAKFESSKYVTHIIIAVRDETHDTQHT